MGRKVLDISRTLKEVSRLEHRSYNLLVQSVDHHGPIFGIIHHNDRSYNLLVQSVEYPRWKRKLVDNDETFNELIQKMRNEKLRFPIGAMGKELK